MTERDLREGVLRENLKDLASETDEKFLARCKVLLPALPANLQQQARELLQVITDKPTRFPQELVYIPVSHETSDMPAEKRMNRELTNLLTAELRTGDLVVSGETASRKYSIDELLREQEEVFRLMCQAGLINPAQLVQLLDLVRVSFFDWAVLSAIGKKGKIQAVGMDSRAGEILATSFEALGVMVRGDDDQSLTNELKFRLGIEGRTRAALNRSARFARSEQRIVFLQGAMHRSGVEAWCRRSNVPFEMRVISGLAHIV